MDRCQSAQRVDHHGEEAEHRGDRHLRERIQQPEPVVHDRREGDDRNRIRGDCVGHERARERPPGGEEERNENAEAAAEHVPAERFLEGVDPLAPERALLVPERMRDRRRLRQQELLNVERRDQALPGGDAEDEDGQRRNPVERGAADAPTDAPGRGLHDRAHAWSSTRAGSWVSPSGAPAAASCSRT